jgi:hypothetical protein
MRSGFAMAGSLFLIVGAVVSAGFAANVQTLCAINGLRYTRQPLMHNCG